MYRGRISKWLVITTQDHTVGALGATCTDGHFLGQMTPILDAANPLEQFFDKTCKTVWDKVLSIDNPVNGNYSYRQALSYLCLYNFAPLKSNGKFLNYIACRYSCKVWNVFAQFTKSTTHFLAKLQDIYITAAIFVKPHVGIPNQAELS